MKNKIHKNTLCFFIVSPTALDFFIYISIFSDTCFVCLGLAAREFWGCYWEFVMNKQKKEQTELLTMASTLTASATVLTRPPEMLLPANTAGQQSPVMIRSKQHKRKML